MSNWSDDEGVLAKFRDWLDEAHAEAEDYAQEGDLSGGDPELRVVGLYQIVEEFTALRHELKLQTKSSRSLDELAGQVLTELQQAIEHFRSVEPKEAQAAEESAKPLIDALIDLDESLLRGLKAIDTARDRIVKQTARQLQQDLDALLLKQTRWRRWICRPWHESVKQLCREHNWTVQEIIDAMIEGYGLIQSRLQRALNEQKIRRMQCVGHVADPVSMTVVEVVDDTSRPPGTVVEEVRPGYLWKDKLFRFAEVRAVKGIQ